MLRKLLPCIAVFVPHLAEASLCNLEPVTLDIPVSCPLVMYKRPATLFPDIAIERNGQPIAIEPMVVRSTYLMLDVDYGDNCGAEYVHETRSEPYYLLEVALPGVEVGDVFQVPGQQPGRIVDAVPASECRTAPEWGPWCHDSGNIDCAAHAAGEGGGCSASGGSKTTWLAVVLGLALASQRRRRRVARSAR